MRRNINPGSLSAGGSSNEALPQQAQQGKVVDSVSHPLTVSWIPPCDTAAGGRLGLTYCPGKHITARDGTRYSRDMRADLTRLRQEHGAHVVVCLLPEAELRYLKVRDYAASVAAHGMEYLHLPIIEMAPPNDMAQAATVVDCVATHVQAGRTVVMHCKGGVGRAGLMAACVLVRLGMCGGATEAIATVRKYRRGAVESRRQEEFVAAYCSTGCTATASRPRGEQAPASAKPEREGHNEEEEGEGQRFGQCAAGSGEPGAAAPLTVQAPLLQQRFDEG